MFQPKRLQGPLALALCLTVGGTLLAPLTVVASTATAANLPAPPPPRPAPTAAQDIKLIEAALGITLTDAQIKAINAAAATRDTAGKAALTTFRTTVAALFGYTPDQLDAAIKALKNVHPDVISQLKAVLGRDLTTAEMKAIGDASKTRDAALEAAANTYRAAVAKILGLTLASLESQIHTYLEANKPKPPAPPVPPTTKGTDSGTSTSGTSGTTGGTGGYGTGTSGTTTGTTGSTSGTGTGDCPGKGGKGGTGSTGTGTTGTGSTGTGDCPGKGGTTGSTGSTGTTDPGHGPAGPPPKGPGGGDCPNHGGTTGGGTTGGGTTGGGTTGDSTVTS